MEKKAEPPVQEVVSGPTLMDYGDFPFDLLKIPEIRRIAARLDICSECGKKSLFTHGEEGFCIRCCPELAADLAEPPDETCDSGDEADIVPLAGPQMEMGLVGT